jgi:hypothetical protein
MTPVIIIVFLTGLFGSYMYLFFQSGSRSYGGDRSFVITKLGIALSTIALGYFTTLFSAMSVKFPSLGLDLDQFVGMLMRLFEVRFVREFLTYVSALWFTSAIALLPYGHTVFDRSTGAVDRERTRQILILHRLVYGLPYYMLLVAFMFSSFLFVIGLGEVNAPHSSMGSLSSLSSLGRLSRGRGDDGDDDDDGEGGGEHPHPEGGGDVDDDDDADDDDDDDSATSSGASVAAQSKSKSMAISSRADLVRKSYEDIRSTLGFYFYHLPAGAVTSSRAQVGAGVGEEDDDGGG